MVEIWVGLKTKDVMGRELMFPNFIMTYDRGGLSVHIWITIFKYFCGWDEG